MRKPVLLGTICWLLAAAATAQAATILVTRRTDVVADDGRCSLREAVTAANTGLPSGTSAGECIGGDPLPVVDVIQLRRGGYKLTLGGAGEDGNAGGDLDVFESVVIEGKGRGRTKIRNRVGDPAIVGDGDRLFHVDPAAAGGVDVTFVGLTLAGGDVACAGEDCVMGASAVESTGNGALTFERCRVLRNTASCYGSGCGDDEGTAAIRVLGGGALSIRRSIMQMNRAVCEGTGCRSGSAAILVYSSDTDEGFILEDSTVKNNTSTCSGPGCLTSAIVRVVAEDVVVRSVELRKNEVACGGSECSGASMVELFADVTATLEDVQANGNTIDCEGDGCRVGVVLHGNGAEDIALQDVGADGNVTTCAGTACSTREHLRVTSGTGDASLERVALVRSVIVCHGDRCRPEEMVDVFAAGTITLRDSRIAEDGVACTGLECDNSGLVRLNAPAFQIERTAVNDNTLVCVGDGCEADRILSLQAVGDAVLTDTDVLRNVNQCVGDDCLASRATDRSTSRAVLRATTRSGASATAARSGPS